MPRGHVFSNKQLISNLTTECDALKNATQMPPLTRSPLTPHPFTCSPAHSLTPHPLTHSLLTRSLLTPHLFLQPCHMPPPQRLHFAAQAEVVADGVVAQDAKAVDDGQRLAGPFHNLFGVQV